MSLDLATEFWAVPANGWFSDPIVCGPTAWTSADDRVIEIDVGSGRIVREFPAKQTKPMATAHGRLLVWRPGECAILGADGRQMSSHERSEHFLSTDDGFLVSQQFGEQVVCLDLGGREVWRFELPALEAGGRGGRGRRFVTGFPSVNVVGKEIFLVSTDLRVVALDSANGRILRSGRLTTPGVFDVLGSDAFSANASQIVQFSFEEMREVHCLNHAPLIEHLYPKETLAPWGLRATKSSFIWTTSGSEWIGISRLAGEQAPSMTWRYEEPGHVTAISERPMVHNGHLYIGTKFMPGHERNGVVVFAGA